jgi:hypothetical protein
MLALKDFRGVSDKSMAIALFAIVVTILLSSVIFPSVITVNAYNGFIQDFSRHFLK